jgi:hypothetical protein
VAINSLQYFIHFKIDNNFSKVRKQVETIMNKTSYILSAFIVFTMLIQSCSKENNSIPVIDVYCYLSSNQLNQTPYFTNKKFDTISFLSSQGDTITFVKTKTDTTWYGERSSNNPDNPSMNYYQIISNKYNTIKGNGSFCNTTCEKGKLISI